MDFEPVKKFDFTRSDGVQTDAGGIPPAVIVSILIAFHESNLLYGGVTVKTFC